MYNMRNITTLTLPLNYFNFKIKTFDVSINSICKVHEWKALSKCNFYARYFSTQIIGLYCCTIQIAFFQRAVATLKQAKYILCFDFHLTSFTLLLLHMSRFISNTAMYAPYTTPKQKSENKVLVNFPSVASQYLL